MASKTPITIPDSIITILNTAANIPGFLNTLYLFTANDFPTFALPTTLFTTCASLPGPLLTTNPSPSLAHTLSRTPLALALVWIDLLVFNVSNQRSETAVQEDKINKPHRPLPSGRITCDGARLLLLALVPLVLGAGWLLGSWQETLLLSAATWMYNHLCGGDENFVLRNLLVAIGYGLYSSAALRVMVGPEHYLTRAGWQCIGVVTAVVFATQRICDIKDAAGDAVLGRRSAPVVLGDGLVRVSVAIPIVVSSVVCPFFFTLSLESYVFTLGLGLLVSCRTLFFRSLASDRTTWKLWVLWICVLFALPLVKSPEVLLKAWHDVKVVVCTESECTDALNLAAMSSVALLIEGRRVCAQVAWGGESANGTRGVPLRIDSNS